MILKISVEEEHGLWIQSVPWNNHEDSDIIIATDNYQDQIEKFYSLSVRVQQVNGTFIMACIVWKVNVAKWKN